MVPPQEETPEGPETFPPPPEKLQLVTLVEPGPVTVQFTLLPRVTTDGVQDRVACGVEDCLLVSPRA
jgi:hypothetical protein